MSLDFFCFFKQFKEAAAQYQLNDLYEIMFNEMSQHPLTNHIVPYSRNEQKPTRASPNAGTVFT